MNSITLIPFDCSFQNKARSLILDGLGEHWGFIDETANPDLDDINESFGDGYFLTAWLGDQMIGTGGIRLEVAGVYRISRMSVQKEFRNNGVGSKILDKLIEWAKQKDATTIVLETTSTWHEIVKFYLKYGFRIIEIDEHDTHFELNL